MAERKIPPTFTTPFPSSKKGASTKMPTPTNIDKRTTATTTGEVNLPVGSVPKIPSR